MRLGRTLFMFPVLALVGVCMHGCLRPTQVTLDISTDLSCKDLRGVAIVAAPAPRIAEERANYPTTQTTACDSGRIGTLVVTPGDDRGTAAIVVVAGVRVPVDQCKPPEYRGCIVARRRFAFVDHTPLTLPISLSTDCIDVSCDADSTCFRGGCVASFVECDEVGCAALGVKPVGADGSSDALADSGRDAPTDGTTLSDASDATTRDADANVENDAGCTQAPEGDGWSTATCSHWNGTNFDAFCIGYTNPQCGNSDPYGGKCSDLMPEPVAGSAYCSQAKCSTTYRCLHRWCAYGCVPGGSPPNWDWQPTYTCTNIGGCGP